MICLSNANCTDTVGGVNKIGGYLPMTYIGMLIFGTSLKAYSLRHAE